MDIRRYISPREAVIVSYCCGCACACVKAALGRPFSHASPHPQSPSCFARVQMFRPKLFCFEKLKYMLHKSRGELSCNTCWMNHICFSGSRCSSRHRTIGCGPILEIGHEPNFCKERCAIQSVWRSTCAPSADPIGHEANYLQKLQNWLLMRWWKMDQINGTSLGTLLRSMSWRGLHAEFPVPRRPKGLRTPKWAEHNSEP